MDDVVLVEISSTADVTSIDAVSTGGTVFVDIAQLRIGVVDVVVPESGVVIVDVVEFGGPPIGYPQLPVELRQLPISFPFGGQVAAGQMVNVPMGFAVTIPDGLQGVRTFAGTPPTADAVFALNRLTGPASVPLGMITLTAASQTDNRLAGGGLALAAGDVLQIVGPAPPDSTLSDVGITIMANRV